MATLKDIQLKAPKILIYGAFGTGKTALAMTLGKRLQLLDFDDGVVTGAGIHDKFLEARMSVDIKQFLETEPGRALAFIKGKAAILDIVNQCNKKTYPFQALCLDSLTTMFEAAMRYILGSSGKLSSIDRPVIPPEIQHWGLAFNEITQVLLYLRTLPIPVVLIAHQQKDMVDGQSMVEVAIPGKNMPDKIPGYFDEVWYMKSQTIGKNTSYVVQTLSTTNTRARTRYGIPDNTDVSIGLEALLNKMGYRFPTAEPSTTPPAVG
jgi:hypothetical protein